MMVRHCSKESDITYTDVQGSAQESVSTNMTTVRVNMSYVVSIIACMLVQHGCSDTRKEDAKSNATYSAHIATDATPVSLTCKMPTAGVMSWGFPRARILTDVCRQTEICLRMPSTGADCVDPV